MNNERMRILFVCGPLEARSTTSHALYLASALSAAGHDVRVATPGGPLQGAFDRKIAPCIVEPSLAGALPWALSGQRVARAAAAACFAPDLVHLADPAFHSQGASVAASFGKPYFVSVHNALRRRQGLRLPAGIFRGLIAGSQEIRENLVNRRKVQRDLVRVISTGVDVTDFRPETRQNDPRKPGIPVVGMVGRLEGHRGADLFVRAAKIVADQGHEAHFLLAGAGPEERDLRILSRELGLEHCLTFATDVHDYKSLLGAIDIFVRPATREGLGISLLEAMACGKPVIASGVGSVFSFVKDGENGYLVPRADLSKLALAVARLVTNPARAMDMGRRARKTVEDGFDIKDKAGETLEFYRRQVETAP